MVTKVIKVETVYGKTFYVSESDLSGPKPKRYQLPLYTRSGIRWDETRAGYAAARRGEATTIHRENIIGQQCEDGSLAALLLEGA
jgi:hypothetical protein